MSERRFRQALVLLGLVALVIIGSMFSSTGPSKAEKEAKVEKEELTKLQQQANAERLERHSKTTQYRMEQAQMALDLNFPGECGAEAKFTYLSNEDISVRCKYDETFAVGRIGSRTFAMRCAGLSKMGITPPAACSVP
jgi:hypothetical protein